MDQKKQKIVEKVVPTIERLMEIRSELEEAGYNGKAKSLNTIIDRLYTWQYKA